MYVVVLCNDAYTIINHYTVLLTTSRWTKKLSIMQKSEVFCDCMCFSLALSVNGTILQKQHNSARLIKCRIYQTIE